MGLRLLQNSNKVLIKEIVPSKTTSSGILTEFGDKKMWDDPTYHKGFKPLKGIVVGVGGGKLLPGGVRQKMSVKIKDIVVYNMYATSKIKHEGKEYISIEENEIIGILEESE